MATSTSEATPPARDRDPSRSNLLATPSLFELLTLGVALFAVFAPFITSCQAQKELPSATFLNIGGTAVKDGATRPYAVTRETVVAFDYDPGATADESVLIVNPGGLRSDGKYYPIASEAMTKDCQAGSDDTICGNIIVGSSPDESAEFTVAIYSVPAQIAGTVREIAQANANQESEGAWSNLPAELGQPLDVISVVRKD